MSSWDEERFDVRRPTSEEDESDGEWHCHLCADGGLTPWPPGTECPNYPCQAFKRPTESYIDHPQAD
jgi:hypothetical protein